MNRQRMIIAVLAVIGIVSVFLPWAKIMGISISGTDAGNDGWIALALYAVALGMAMMGDRTQPLGGKFKWGAVVAGLLAAAVGILNIMDVTKDLAAKYIGIGLWLTGLAGVLILVVALAMGGGSAPSAPADTSEG